MGARKLKHTELNNICLPSSLNFETTKDLEPLNNIIGQERAVEAFNFGLRIKNKGYNIYMAGPSGVGKTTYAKISCENQAKKEEVPKDWCYVYNFENPRNPIALSFEAGRGKEFKEDMNELVVIFEEEIQKAFNTDDYEKQKVEIVKSFDIKKDNLMKKMNDIATAHDFAVKSTNAGVYFLPVIKGETVNEEEFEELDESVKEEIVKKSAVVQEQVAYVMRDLREEDKACKKAVDDLDYKIGMFAIGHHVNIVQEKYKNYDRVLKYIEAVQEDVLENISQFVPEDGEEEDMAAALLPMITVKKTIEDITLKYKVNLIIDNSKTEGAPVVLDFNPTYHNLVGEVEYDNEFGNWTTDFMKIKPGIFHKANGGYIILQAHDLLNGVQSWEAVRRIVKTGEISMEPMREPLTSVAASTLKPEPIPITIKVIIIGNPFYYEILREYEEDFDKYFKILADFDYEMPRTDDNIINFSRFIASYTKKENLLPCTAEAVAKIIEYGSRLVESQDKLSLKFNAIGQIIYEAETWAKIDEDTMVTAAHVKKAIEKKKQRLRMYEEKLNEMIDQNVIMINTTGELVGEINGLSVLDLGNYTFGNPSKITATTYIGKSGIVNIEKEAHMSGPSHSKGVQVITGFLGERYAQEFPLSLSCRICFEQNYNGIDGDSASSTELYAIISSLSGVPINQGIAVTGSVNQKGEVQAIGGVTQKIEGFYDVCKKRGLTGAQGVLIPQSNIKDLVLKEEVIEDVKNGKFNIYAVSHIDEGIEVLTGKEAGKVDKNGKFPINSINHKVHKKLHDYYKKSMGDRKK